MKTKIFLVQALLIIVSFQVEAQEFQWAKKSNSSQTYDVAVDNLGNTYLSGIKWVVDTLSGNPYNDIFLSKYDINGTCLWNRQFGGKVNDGGIGICLDGNGSFFITGYFQDTVSFGSITLISTALSDMFIAKFDSSGTCLWAKKAGGEGQEMGTKIKTDPYGNIYVTGTFNKDIDFGTVHLTGSTSDDIFLAKYNNQGTCIWVKKAGGNFKDYSWDLILDVNGNIIISGFFINTITFESFLLTSYGLDDAFAAKYDSDGNCLWVKNAGGSLEDVSSGISSDGDGNIYMAGYFQGILNSDSLHVQSLGARDFFIIKYSPEGNSLWIVSGANNLNDYSYGISSDKNGNSYIIGAFYGTATVGNVQLNSYGNYDIFWAKYDQSGSCLWATHAGGPGQDVPFSIAVDSLKTISTVGLINSFTAGIATFGNFQISSEYVVDFITKLSDLPLRINNDISALELNYFLQQNYPNPFNPSTTINYYIPETGRVILKVYDLLGKEVELLVNEIKSKGNHSVEFKTAMLPSGVYFYKMQSGEFSAIKKMVLLR